MYNKTKDTLTFVGWFALGTTAIAVEKCYHTGKQIKSELDNNMPQDLVRYTITNIKARMQHHGKTTESVA